MKPILFLDFDGVLNAFPHKFNWVGERPLNGHQGADFNDPKNWELEVLKPNVETHFELDVNTTAEHNGHTYKITYSSELVESLRKLIVEDKIKLVWLTSWREASETKLNPMLGFPKDKVGFLAWQSTSISPRNPQIGKYYGLCDYIEKREKENLIDKGTPLIWVDDLATVGFANLSPNEIKYRKKNESSPLDNYPSLVLTPDEKWGISRKELRSIQKLCI